MQFLGLGIVYWAAIAKLVTEAGLCLSLLAWGGIRMQLWQNVAVPWLVAGPGYRGVMLLRELGHLAYGDV